MFSILHFFPGVSVKYLCDPGASLFRTDILTASLMDHGFICEKQNPEKMYSGLCRNPVPKLNLISGVLNPMLVPTVETFFSIFAFSIP